MCRKTKSNLLFIFFILFFNLNAFIQSRVFVNINSESPIKSIDSIINYHGTKEDIDLISPNLSKVSLTSLKIISFCIDCPSPGSEGSYIIGLNSKFGSQNYNINTDLIIPLPNKVHKKRIYNYNQLKNKIVLVERGEVSIIEKIFLLQKYFVSAILIVNSDDSCGKFFTKCQPKSLGSIFSNGFAPMDDEIQWRKVKVPVLLINFEDGEKLKKVLNVKEIFIKGIGLQNTTTLYDDEHDEL